MPSQPFPHLRVVDEKTWPGIAQVPTTAFSGFRARRAEAQFAAACAKAELALEGPDADITVDHDALFFRIAHTGWLGLAESYMAGEWSTPDSDRLVKVLRGLISAGYSPRADTLQPEDSLPGELPRELVQLYSGDGSSHSGGIFSSGVPTTVRGSVESFATGRNEPKAHFVDVTTLSEPGVVDREDLADAQRRSADWLLDAAHVGAGTHLLVYPASSLQAALRATKRRATIDLVTADEAQCGSLEEDVVLEGAQDSIHVLLSEEPIPGPKQLRGRYDAVVSVEKLETTSPRERRRYVQLLDRLLASGGRAVFQSLVATEKHTPAAAAASQVMRAYIWPGLEYPTTMDVNRLVDKHSHLRVIAQMHYGPHYAESLRHQRSYFEGHLREAAAAGFDPVFRRLWMYQFALREVLLDLGMLDAVQFTATHRHRGGKR